jgi:hypothetical protein
MLRAFFCICQPLYPVPSYSRTSLYFAGVVPLPFRSADDFPFRNVFSLSAGREDPPAAFFRLPQIPFQTDVDSLKRPRLSLACKNTQRFEK